MDPRKQIGGRIRELRNKRKLSQDQLAASATMAGKHLSSIERGLENPTLDTFLKLSSALGVELWELLNYGHRLEGKALKTAINNKLKKSKDDDLRLILKFINTLLD